MISPTIAPTRAETVVAALAREVPDGAVVATGVATPLAILAIAVARLTHAPGLTYLSAIGSMDPSITRLWRSSEDLAYLDGRSGEVTIPDLFDHARRGRIDVMFFGAAEVDAHGRTNLTAAGTIERPRVKFPGAAGSGTLRRWVRHPVLFVGRQSRRSLVERVQITSTVDPRRRSRLVTDLGIFELGQEGAKLVSRHPWGTPDAISDRTGFGYRAAQPLPVTITPEPEVVQAIRSIDADGLRERLVG